ncbi:P-loop containing nucleoside triphosphate hydrolase protein, partial [Fragilariopsis cylindrus CCMP1102]
LVRNINWRIEPNDKWALVGANGCGKSTLLKAILNDITDNKDPNAIIDYLDVDGDITIQSKQQVGYLKQTAVSGSIQTIFEEASSSMKDITSARTKLRRAEQQVESYSTTDDTIDTENDARQHYERVGGYIQEQEVHTLLQGLGFTNMTQLCSELSGGWQMRVSFAKMLLSKPSLCLLDEPSNHLDRSARKWLANYLKNYQDGALLLVTHDIELLKSCNHIAEITGTEGSSRTVQIYKSCTYEQYLLQKRERAIAAQLEYEKNMEKFQKLQAFVDKWGASATKASAAQSRVIQIEKMREQGLLEPPSTAISEIVKFKPRLTLPDPPAPQGGIGDSSDSIAAATAIANATPLITDINLDIQQGMKILIRGPNGAGKTTLLDTLRGRLPLLNGERVEDSNLRLGVFTQDLAQELDVSRRAVDLVTEYARSGDDGNIFISDQEARNILGGLGLQGEKALRKVGQLSGGEKARVALAQFALKPSNLYLLDEVSNHLDIECVEALSEVLSDWGDGKGAIVVISHDKAFCEQVGFTHILTITGDGQLQLEQRDANDNDWD